MADLYDPDVEHLVNFDGCWRWFGMTSGPYVEWYPLYQLGITKTREDSIFLETFFPADLYYPEGE